MPDVPDDPRFFKIEGDSSGRNGLWFSPYSYDHDVRHWSHEYDFPWLLRNADGTEVDLSKERCDVVAAVAQAIFLAKADKLNNQYGRISSEEQICRMNAMFFRTWAEMKS